MLCPKCLSKTKVIDTRNNMEENETYRRRVCDNKECGYRFYTVEFAAEDNDCFKTSWKESINGGR